MQNNIPWYAYLAILAFYLFFEAFYRLINHSFFATDMLVELLAVIKKLAEERESDKDGARLCSLAVTIFLILSPILIIWFSIAAITKYNSTSDIVLGLILIVCFIPIMLGLQLLNELWMSWVKKIRS